jgi:hypothetical protein
MPVSRRRFYYSGKQQQCVRILRAHEFAEKQKVSLMEIEGIGLRRIRLLWKAGITTAQELLDADEGFVFNLFYPSINPRKGPKLSNSDAEFQAIWERFLALCTERGMEKPARRPEPSAQPPS